MFRRALTQAEPRDRAATAGSGLEPKVRFLPSRLNIDGLFNIDWGLSLLFLSLLNLASPPVTDQLAFEINRIAR